MITLTPKYEEYKAIQVQENNIKELYDFFRSVFKEPDYVLIFKDDLNKCMRIHWPKSWKMKQPQYLRWGHYIVCENEGKWVFPETLEGYNVKT